MKDFDSNMKEVPDLAAINRHIFWSAMHGDTNNNQFDYDLIDPPFEDQIKILVTALGAMSHLAKNIKYETHRS